MKLSTLRSFVNSYYNYLLIFRFAPLALFHSFTA